MVVCIHNTIYSYGCNTNEKDGGFVVVWAGFGCGGGWDHGNDGDSGDDICCGANTR